MHESPEQAETAEAAAGEETRRLSRSRGGTLLPNELLAGRYRIVRFIARGGMGEVFEAQDLELRDRLALKTIRPAIARDARAVERFKREITLARRVTHRNACRIFDLAVHEPEVPGAGGPVWFLTMELLEGPTLAQRIAEGGPMGAEEALPLVRQMAAALDAAHAAGVVHRDLKCGNVLLVPDAAEPCGTRLVVTDFGLARSHREPGADPFQSSTGVVMGTPHYMAPEQLEGGEATPATDLHAFGVVLHVLRTGVVPAAQGAARLEPAWDAAIRRCLERDPRDRPASASDVVRAIERPGVEPRGAQRRRAVTAIAAVAVAGLGIAALLTRDRVAGSPAAPPDGRRSVAVLAFQNVSERAEAAWLGTAISEMLATELGAGEHLRVVPGETVARARSDLDVPATAGLAPDTLSRLRALVGSDVVVLGSYTAMAAGEADTVRIDLRIQDARRGETLAQFAQAGTVGALFDVVSRAGARLRAELGAGAPTGAELAAVRAAASPEGAEAARLHAIGLERLRAADGAAARDALEQCVALDPSFAPARAALSQAYALLGYERRAREEAAEALSASGALPRTARLRIEARAHETAARWDEATATWGRLVQEHPDSLEDGLALAEALGRAGRSAEALRALDALRATAAGVEDPRVDLAEARVAMNADQPRALAAARRAAAGAERQGARHLVVRAVTAGAGAARGLGRAGEAEALIERALRAADDADAPYESALAHLAAFSVLHDASRFEEGLAAADHALELGRRLGSPDLVARALHARATPLRCLGRREEALASLEEAIALNRESGLPESLLAHLEASCSVLADLGRLDEAAERLEEVLLMRRDADSPLLTSSTLQSLAHVRWDQGRAAEARDAAAESLRLARDVGGERYTVGREVFLARVSLAEGRLEGLAATLESSAGFYREAQLAEFVAETEALLADVRLAEGRLAAAADAVARARSEAASSRYLPSHAVVELAAARVAGARDDAGAFVTAMEEALAVAARSGHAVHELDARLGLAEAKLRAGRRAEAREELQDVRRRATAAGIGRVAQGAEALLSRTSPFG